MAHCSSQSVNTIDYFAVIGINNTTGERHPTSSEPFPKYPLVEQDHHQLYWEEFAEEVVDIQIYCPDSGIAVPAGYTVIWKTPEGNSANLHHGALMSKPIFLCVRKRKNVPKGSKNLSPIVELDVVVGRKEQQEKSDFTIVKMALDGSRANLYSNSLLTKAYLAFRRQDLSENGRYESTISIIDICVINESKGESVPFGYLPVQAAANKESWMSGSDRIRLCFQLANTTIPSMMDIPFLPTLLDRVPRKDDQDRGPMPSSVELFCAPNGMKAIRCYETELPLPHVSYFVLTDENRKFRFGTSLTFYEQMDTALVEKMEQEHDDFLSKLRPISYYPFSTGWLSESVLNISPISTANASRKLSFFVPKCLCIISKYPIFDCSKMCLQQLLRLSASGNQLEHYVKYILKFFPLPSPGGPTVQIHVGGSNFGLRRSASTGVISPSQIDYRVALQTMGTRNFIELIRLFVMEQKILLLSNYSALLVQIAEAVRTILFPFDWQGVYVPNCPEKFLGILEAPMAFVVGTTIQFRRSEDESYQNIRKKRSFLRRKSTDVSSFPDIPKDIWVIDLDTDRIFPPRSNSAPTIPDFPDHVKSHLFSQISEAKVKLGLDNLDNFHKQKQKSMSSTHFNVDPNLAFPVPRDSDEIGAYSKWATLSVADRSIAFKIIRDAGLRALATLLKGYINFILPPDVVRSAWQMEKRNLGKQTGSFRNCALNQFDVDEMFAAKMFIQTKPACATFLKLFLRTQMFTKFLEDRFSLVTTKIGEKYLFFDQVIRVLQSSKNPKALLVDQIQHSKSPGVNRVIIFDADSYAKDEAKRLPNSETKYASSDVFQKFNEDFLEMGYCADSIQLELCREDVFGPLDNIGAGVRTMEEIGLDEIALTAAYNNQQRNNTWALLLKSQILSTWFCLTPSYISESSNKLLSLVNAIRLFEQMWATEEYRNKAVESSFRSLFSCCETVVQSSKYCFDPVLYANRLYNLMLHARIVPNAATAGHFTNILVTMQEAGSEPLLKRQASLRTFSEVSKLVNDKMELSPMIEEEPCYPVQRLTPRSRISSVAIFGSSHFILSAEKEKLTRCSSLKDFSEETRELISPSDIEDLKAFSARTLKTINGEQKPKRHIFLWTMSPCVECDHAMLDENILAGWENDPSQYSIKCSSCSCRVVPKLNVAIVNSLGDKSRYVANEKWTHFQFKDHGFNRDASCGHCELLSPIVVRKLIEQLVQDVGAKVLAQYFMLSKYPTLYWNLCFYFHRLALPLWKERQGDEIHAYWDGVRAINQLFPDLGKQLSAVASFVEPHPMFQHAVNGGRVMSFLATLQPEVVEVWNEIWTEIKTQDVKHAVEIFLRTRSRYSMGESKMRPDWETFGGSMYLSLFTLYQESFKSNSASAVFERSLYAAIGWLGRDLSEELKASDYPPSNEALKFRSCFGWIMV